MSVVHTLFDFFDKSHSHPIERTFETPLQEGSEFTIEGVTYKVVGRLNVMFMGPVKFGNVPSLEVRMTRYKVENSSTQFVHKCPAKPDGSSKITDDDMMKFDPKKQKRVKLRTYNVLEQACPHCKVIFWKERNEIPPEVHVDKVMGKKNANNRKRRKSG